MENIWDRQKGENSMWFERFETYRMMGPGRTLLGTVNEMLVDKGEKKRKSAPSSWEINSDKFNWKGRATAWDDHQRHLTRMENEKEHQKARKARVSLIMAGIEKCREALSVVNPQSAKFGEIMTGIKTLNEQARIEFGESPTVTELTFEILEGVSNGELSLRDAAIRFNKEGLELPESIRIMLSKEPPVEEPEQEGGLWSEEELEKKYLEGMAKVQAEVENFVPKRQEDVRKIKAELSDKNQWEPA